MSNHSSRHNKDSSHHKRVNMDISVDNLFPSDIRSGTKGRKLDVESLFSNTPLNNEPEITFSSNIILEKREKRRKEKLNYYRHMLKYCHKRITDADDDQGSDIVFTVIESVPECKDYDSLECLEFISVKLREEDFDTTILTSTTMFITWKYLELKKQERIDAMKKAKEEKDCKSKETRDTSHTSHTSSHTANRDESQKHTKEIIVSKNDKEAMGFDNRTDNRIDSRLGSYQKVFEDEDDGEEEEGNEE